MSVGLSALVTASRPLLSSQPHLSALWLLHPLLRLQLVGQSHVVVGLLRVELPVLDWQKFQYLCLLPPVIVVRQMLVVVVVGAVAAAVAELVMCSWGPEDVVPCAVAAAHRLGLLVAA